MGADDAPRSEARLAGMSLAKTPRPNTRGGKTVDEAFAKGGTSHSASKRGPHRLESWGGTQAAQGTSRLRRSGSTRVICPDS